MLDVPADSSRRDAERLCRYLCRNPSGRRGAFAARCRVTAACMVLSHGRMLDPSDPTRKTLETILAAVLCELGIQYKRTSAPRGVPCMSRITEVRGFQKTCSSSPPCVDRTTMPSSEADSSMPRCLCTSEPKYRVTSCPIQASGICSAIDILSRVRLLFHTGILSFGVGLRARPRAVKRRQACYKTMPPYGRFGATPEPLPLAQQSASLWLHRVAPL